MLKKSFKSLLKSLKNRPREFDPSYFNDPIALQTGWNSNSSYDSEIRVNQLIKVNANRLEFQSTFNSKLPFFIFLSCGIIFIFVYFFLSEALSFMGVFIPLLFIITSCILLYLLNIPVVFDKQKGLFWKGRHRLSSYGIINKPRKYFLNLEEIYALQLICRGGYDETGYELNLALKNGNRINVASSGDKNKLREDTRVLSVFLTKPIWDAI